MEDPSKFSISHSPELYDPQSSNVWYDHGDKKVGIGVVLISNEEMKIRNELEMEIEKELEEELKDGIYQLAMRLHQLYQSQIQRINEAYQTPILCSENKQAMKNKTPSEVKIGIKMEGRRKTEFEKVKKEISRPKIIRSDDAVVNSKRFDWATSLRSLQGNTVAIEKARMKRKNNISVCASAQTL